MEDCERVIEVRALIGESIAVSILTDRIVGELKQSLRQSFALAAKYLDFNLYHKGVKLSLRNKISGYCIEPGEVIGFVPVIRKQVAHSHTFCDSGVPSPSDRTTSKFADVAWSDMMEEIRDVSSNKEEGLGNGSGSTGAEGKLRTSGERSSTGSFRRRRRRNVDSETDDLVLSLLQASSKNVFDVGNREKFLKVLDPVNCLRNPCTSSCLLLSVASLREYNKGQCSNSVSSCLCPQWLRTTAKAFSFLNIYAASLQLQQREITLNSLRQAVDCTSTLGIRVTMKDIENLSLLCPKVYIEEIKLS